MNFAISWTLFKRQDKVCLDDLNFEHIREHVNLALTYAKAESNKKFIQQNLYKIATAMGSSVDPLIGLINKGWVLISSLLNKITA